MFELSDEDKQELLDFTRTTSFEFAEATLDLAIILDKNKYGEDTLERVKQFKKCSHKFEPYAFSDTSYDSSKHYYVICRKCYFQLFIKRENNINTKYSIIIDGSLYVDFEP